MAISNEDILLAIGEISQAQKIETERFKIIMTTMQDFETKQAQIAEQIATLAAKQADMQTIQKTAVADLGIAVASGHSTLVDKMMVTMTNFGMQLSAIDTAMEVAHKEFKEALATVPTMPAAAPVA